MIRVSARIVACELRRMNKPTKLFVSHNRQNVATVSGVIIRCMIQFEAVSGILPV